MATQKSSKSNIIRLHADSYTLDWCIKVTSIVRTQWELSDNLMNAILNVALNSSEHPKKFRKLIHEILSQQEEIPMLSSIEIDTIINIVL